MVAGLILRLLQVGVSGGRIMAYFFPFNQLSCLTCLVFCSRLWDMREMSLLDLCREVNVASAKQVAGQVTHVRYICKKMAGTQL